MHFEEYESCIAARLDIYKWELNKYPSWLKAGVVAWYRMHGTIENHVQDAINRKMKRDSKRKNR